MVLILYVSVSFTPRFLIIWSALVISVVRFGCRNVVFSVSSLRYRWLSLIFVLLFAFPSSFCVLLLLVILSGCFLSYHGSSICPSVSCSALDLPFACPLRSTVHKVYACMYACMHSCTHEYMCVLNMYGRSRSRSCSRRIRSSSSRRRR